MKLKIASLNIKGRKSESIDKWMHIPQIMCERKMAILAMQETHLTDKLTHTRGKGAWKPMKTS